MIDDLICPDCKHHLFAINHIDLICLNVVCSLYSKIYHLHDCREEDITNSWIGDDGYMEDGDGM